MSRLHRDLGLSYVGRTVVGMSAQPLTERQIEILAFESRWWKYAGAKDAAIREEFDCSATRYYQELRGILDLEAAYVHSPMLVKRLRRLRETRARARQHPAGRRLG